MSDRAAVALAAAVVAGALAAFDVPPWVGLLLVTTAFVARRPALLCLGACALSCTLAFRSWDGLRPATPHPYAGTATLVSDPERAFGGVRADVRVGRQRLEAWARGSSAAALAGRLAGDRIDLVGRVQQPPPGATWLTRRHVVGRLAVETITGWRPGNAVVRLANGLRRTLARGAASLRPDRRALFAGFVLGDDRDEPADIADDFRASGLSHLLAVSGQNVAFVLALAGPVLRRTSLRARLPLTLAVIGFFALLTRFEPSVLRACVMAALATTAATLGREASSMRLLALAVAGLVLVDPLLVRSVGFQLSVAASAAIVLLAGRIAARIPGPRPLADALGVTLAAQVGVAPILVPVFGGLPVASVPANLLAVPAAGPVMVWGLSAGIVAGLVGGAAARVIHVPTDLLLRWVAGVARWGASLPLGELRFPHLALLATVVAVGAGARRWAPRARPAVALAGIAVVLSPAVALRAPPPFRVEPVPGATLYRAGGATVLAVDDEVDTAGLLESLRRLGARRLDLVVVAGGGRPTADALGPVLRRYPPRLLLAPSTRVLAGAQVPEAGTTISVGALDVAIASVSPRLDVSITARRLDRAAVGSPGAPRARAPPP